MKVSHRALLTASLICAVACFGSTSLLNAQGLAISPTSMTLTSHLSNGSQGTFTVTNNGSSTVTGIYEWLSVGQYFSVKSSNCSSLAPGQHCYVTVEFNPGEVCIYPNPTRDTLNVEGSGGGVRAALTGRQESCIDPL